MRSFREILQAVSKKTGFSTELPTYWHTDSGKIIGKLFSYMQESKNLSWVIEVTRILEFDWSSLSWTCLTEAQQKRLTNLLALSISTHIIVTSYLFKFEIFWIGLIEKTSSHIQNYSKI